MNFSLSPPGGERVRVRGARLTAAGARSLPGGCTHRGRGTGYPAWMLERLAVLSAVVGVLAGCAASEAPAKTGAAGTGSSGVAGTTGAAGTSAAGMTGAAGTSGAAGTTGTA